MRYFSRFMLFVLCCLLLNSCSWWTARTRHGVSSSLVQFLYPEGQEPPKYEQEIPNLKLPLTVGLAFVPSEYGTVRGLSEQHKTVLLEKVKQHFVKRDFINNIILIPDIYLRSSRGGFTGLEQIARLYGLDVMALVSYDQVTQVEDNPASFLYWTIVGAYFIPATENEVQTFVDTTIFDVKTHQLLFRAPGVHKSSGYSTLVGADKEARKAEEESFSLAMEAMTKNLETELEAFRQRVKTQKVATITYRPGFFSGGGGALEWPILGVLLGLYFLQKRSEIVKRKDHA